MPARIVLTYVIRPSSLPYFSKTVSDRLRFSTTKEPLDLDEKELEAAT